MADPSPNSIPMSEIYVGKINVFLIMGGVSRVRVNRIPV